MAEYTLVDPALAILSQVGRWMYVAALGIALLGLAAVAMRRLGDRLRRSYALVFLSTAIALFAACDLTLGVSRLDSMVPSVLNFAVLGMIWVLPIAIWVWRAQGDSGHWWFSLTDALIRVCILCPASPKSSSRPLRRNTP